MTRMHGGWRGFTLVEVIVALGVLALMLPFALALFGTLAGVGRDGADAETAARLAGSVQDELERLRGELGWEGLAAAIPPAGSAVPLRLVAARDGLHLLRADGEAPPADHRLDDNVLPGIARRDRYFLVEVTQSPDLPYNPGAGFLTANVRITWPHRLPAGPASSGAVAVDADPSIEAPRERRHWLVVTLALRP